MIQELQDIFPKFTEQKIWKILITIKTRYVKYGTIGISRLEASRFWTSQRQMQAFITYLRQIRALRKKRMAIAINGFKCNVYSLAGWFVEWLEEVKSFVKKVFTYINPVEYVKAKFTYKQDRYNIKFDYNWEKYYIPLRGRFKWKIFSVLWWNNGNWKLINPLTLTK